MCGICGFSWEDKTLLKRMTDSIRHRGPNSAGHFVDKGISLGNRRLSIIDLSKKGNQPIYNEDKTIALVYNGEIFNFLELREELVSLGHRFVSHTDSEVVVHAYEEWGEECLSRFNGFWGFALYDMKKQRVFIARDRLGLKPLYYSYDGKRLAFASEMKALLALKGLKKSVNREALSKFLTYRYTSGSVTIFDSVRRLNPAQYMLFDIKTKKLVIKDYWNVPLVPVHKDLGAAKKEVVKLLSDSVSRRLISDVPIGVYLSGGIDSSSIVAMMAKQTKDIRTYALSFSDDKVGNELSYAQKVAAHFSTAHTEITITPDIVKDLPKMVWHLDEPMSDPAAVPVYYLSREAKKKVTVVLTGDGADELFAGYDQYKFLQKAHALRNVPSVIRSNIHHGVKLVPKVLLNKVYKYAEATGEEAFTRLGKLLTDISSNKAKAYTDVVGIFDDSERAQVLKDDVGLDYTSINKTYFSKGDFLTQVMHFDLRNYLPEDLLMKPDKMCMAHGIEARVPYLDYRLVEYAFGIPTSMKLRGGESKYVLKKALHGVLPSEILYRKKQPFHMPLDSWMSSGLKEVFFDLLSDDCAKEYFNAHYVEKIKRKYAQSPLYYGRQLWSLGNFVIWHKTFVDEEKVKL